jgi:hypothetical protein
LQVLEVAGFDNADGEPLRSREIAHTEKQLTRLLEKERKLNLNCSFGFHWL